ncbi:blue copper protein-like [Lolium rigidum]|uniref:blue copper protein-like n=1 Tax=Lolium rigidum TaxID=89674 RepID=UPI001F5C9B7F|nr:blue copper protein-like [Lolium rigidum]
MHALINLVVASIAVALLQDAVSAAGNATASPGRNTTALPPFGANHTVGDSAGWFFDGKANASAANYSVWAANRTFYLGDYLTFKTRTDNTVVHTTNATVYKLCGYDGDGVGGGWKPEEAFLTVMLAAEGANYFFSDAGEGEHCRRGMRFDITVAHGRGLPQVPPSYYEPLSRATAGRCLGVVVPVWVLVAVLLML